MDFLWPFPPASVPDQSSRLECAQWSTTPQDFLCVLSLRRKGQLLKAEKLKPGRLYGRVHQLEDWTGSARGPWDIQSHLGGAVFSATLGRRSGSVARRSRRSPTRQLRAARFEFSLNRLTFEASPSIETTRGGCAQSAMVLGASLCGPVVWSALTLAILDENQKLDGVASATELWLEVHLRKFDPTFEPWRQSRNRNVFFVSLMSSTEDWALMQALHPSAGRMGSFVAPSAQAQGFALPLEVVEDAGLLQRLMGRCPDVLALYVTNDEEVARAWRLAQKLMDTSTVCFLGPNTLRLPGGEIAPHPWPINALQCLTTLTAAPYQATRMSWSRLDISNALGWHLQGNVAVASVATPSAQKIWLEVGCNNWDLLRDQLPLDGSVWLLTLEPLVDKFAFLHAHQDPRQLVLPFAVAERDFGPFAALRSQNYSNFLGREGVTFQESGASSLLPYAEGFLDHRWEGSQAQYQNFREYMVPTVSLEWVVGTLLGRNSIEFLKIDAQGRLGDHDLRSRSELDFLGRTCMAWCGGFLNWWCWYRDPTIIQKQLFLKKKTDQ